MEKTDGGTAGNRKRLSIYIHIPFCIRKCFYCDFLSFPAEETQKEQYVQALLQEIREEAGRYASYTVETVFIGGGTPSVLSAGQIERIMDCLTESFSFASGEGAGDSSRLPEITIEVNPGTVTPDQLKSFRAAGINRISIGTQSVQDHELELLGRIHRAADFFNTYEMAEAAGFSNVNVDIMSALPGQTLEAYTDTLSKVCALHPAHISAYSLIIEEGTYFYRLYGEGAEGRQAFPVLPTEEEEREMYEQTEAFLKNKGYHRYEISNYAKPGMECRHNTAYWRRYNYAGFGLGAASMVENVRWKNTSDMTAYLSRFLLRAETDGGKEEIQVLSIKEQMEEFMFLGLRLTEGVSRKEFYSCFGTEMDSVYGPILEKLCGQGLLTAEEWVRLTPYGRDISNYVMAEFLLDGKDA